MIIFGTCTLMDISVAVDKNATNGGIGDLLDPWGKTPEYNWGFVGAGPLNLARAILFNVFGGMIAFRYCRRFTREVVSKLGDNFTLTDLRVKRWVTRQKKLDRLARRRELYRRRKLSADA